MVKQLRNEREDKDLLLSYLYLVDEDFGIPLSLKHNLEDYASKLLRLGIVIVVMIDGEIQSCRAFYCNNTESRVAYGSMMSTLSKARGKGYAKLLVEEMIKICRIKGFKSIISSSINPVAISLYKSVGYQEISRNVTEDGKICVTLEYKI